MLGTTLGVAETVLLLMVDELTGLDEKPTEGELIEDESVNTAVEVYDVEV